MCMLHFQKYCIKNNGIFVLNFYETILEITLSIHDLEYEVQNSVIYIKFIKNAIYLTGHVISVIKKDDG